MRKGAGSSRPGRLTLWLLLLCLSGCATLPRLPEEQTHPGGRAFEPSYWLVLLDDAPVALVSDWGMGSGALQVQGDGRVEHVTVQHASPVQLLPLVERREGGRRVVFHDDGRAGQSARVNAWIRALSQQRYREVDTALEALGWSERDDAALELMKALWEDDLALLARAPEGRLLLERLYDELTAGNVSEEELHQAQRLLALEAQRLSPEDFVARTLSPETKRFSYREGGFTVFNDTPLSAHRGEAGRIVVELSSRSYRPEYAGESKTLPGLRMALEPDEVIGVRLYDEGEVMVYAPALFLLQLSHADDAHAAGKALEAAGLGLGFGAGVLAEAGVAVPLRVRVLLACDQVALALGTATSLIREHRGWIRLRFGREGEEFLRWTDVVNSGAALYGMTRLVMGGTGLVLGGLRASYTHFLAQVRQAKGLTPEELETLAGLQRDMEGLLSPWERVETAPSVPRAGTQRSASAGVKAEAAPSAPKVKVVQLQRTRAAESVPTPKLAQRVGPPMTPAPARAPAVAVGEDALAATGTDGPVVSVKQPTGVSRQGTPVASAADGPGEGVKPSVPGVAPSTPSKGTEAPSRVSRPSREPLDEKPVQALRLVRAGREVAEPTDAELTESRFLEIEAEATEGRLAGDAAALRQSWPRLEQPLPGAENNRWWPRFCEYFESRLAEIEQFERGQRATRPKNPLGWEAYKGFKETVERGTEYGRHISTVLQEELTLPPKQRTLLPSFSKARVDSSVGVAKDGFENTLFVDHMVIDMESIGEGKTPHVECFSDKSRAFKKMTEKNLERAVAQDIDELKAKYGSPLEIRRPGHPLFGKKVDVSRLHLVYDLEGAKDYEDAIRRAAGEVPTDVMVHFR